MAQKMDQKACIVKIGKEAFDLLEEYGSPLRKARPKKTTTGGGYRLPMSNRCYCNNRPTQPPFVDEVKPVIATHEQDNHDAMVMYADRLLMDYSKKKSTPMAY